MKKLKPGDDGDVLLKKLDWLAFEYAGTEAGQFDDNGEHVDLSDVLREAADRIRALAQKTDEDSETTWRAFRDSNHK